ncbi:hypothetical protein [Pantoea agglomerans]|uniref:hypothetical protein n=1 Tax=Enterobacter agglomerans TaxID=549 RepID=UPI003C79FEB6
MNNSNPMDELDFIGSVLVFPFVISLTFVFFFTWLLTRKERDIKKLSASEFAKFAFTLHPDKGLMQQGLLWLSIITPITYFIELLGMATEGYVLRLDGEGFKIFTSIATLPLAIASLTIPLSVLVARFHSSQQTAEQIKANRQKNNTDLFHSHRKELFSYFDQVGETKYLKNLVAKNKIHPRVHKVYFKGRPQDGVPSINEALFIEVEYKLRSARSYLVSVLENRNPDLTFSTYIASFGGVIFELSQNLGLPEVAELMSSNRRVPFMLDNKRLQLETVGISTDEAIATFKLIENFFHNLCDFANYTSPYFIEDESKIEYNNALRKIRDIPKEDRVIEKLRQNEIFNAMNDERLKKW